VTESGERFTVTFFEDKAAETKRERALTLGELAELAGRTEARKKNKLPLLKLARFGDEPSDNDSLRYDGNVLKVTGVIGDYDNDDGSNISFNVACEMAKAARIRCVLYTTPSNKPGDSRWRAIAPVSEELSPDQHTKLMDRLNGAFGGVFAPESWTLSQPYYYGFISGNDQNHCVGYINGRGSDYLDLRADLPVIGKPDFTTGGGGVGSFDEAAAINAIINGATITSQRSLSLVTGLTTVYQWKKRLRGCAASSTKPRRMTRDGWTAARMSSAACVTSTRSTLGMG
jgi:hypothetical protein